MKAISISILKQRRRELVMYAKSPQMDNAHLKYEKLIKEVDEAVSEIEALSLQIAELKMMEEDAQQYALKCRKELEALQQRNCEGCRADCSVKDALNTHGQYWDYPSDIGCKSRYEAKEK